MPLQLLLQLGDFALDLAAVDAGLTGCNQLALDLVDDLDGAVDAGVGGVDGRGTEAEGVLHGGERLRCRSAWWSRSTSRRRCPMRRRRDSRWRCGSASRSVTLLVCVSVCSAVMAATLVLMLVICGDP